MSKAVHVPRALELLAELGPMTQAELAELLGLDRFGAAALMNVLRRPLKTIPKRVHIIKWVTDHPGQRSYPRAVYALGEGVDVPRPKRNYKKVKQRYEQNKRTRLRMSSVFRLGAHLKDIRSGVI